MKRQTTIAMFGILFAAAMALGTVTASGLSQPLFVASTDTQAASHMGMLGHITLTATDSDGKIISYIQTDNVIVNIGENCVAESIFNVTTTDGTHACTGTGIHTCSGAGCTPNGVNDGGFTSIAIGTGGSTGEADDDTALVTETMRQKDESPSVVDSTGSGGTSAVVTLTSVFTATGITTIDESGIFDDPTASSGNMLARKDFTGIPLTAGDNLTVEWEITIGS